jgi:hypothetical protein
MAPSATWTTVEETKLVDFFVANKAEAGDGGNFKKATFQFALAVITPFHDHGAAKTVKSCQNKWAMVSLCLASHLEITHLIYFSFMKFIE